MSDLSNQQINQTFAGLLQVPGGITSTLKTVQDGNGNPTGLQISSTGANVTTSNTFVASQNGTQFTGAVPRLISDGFGDIVSVRDFGAVGDGVTDETTAFQNAIAQINSVGGGSLYIPEGVYYFPDAATTLNPAMGNIKFFGDGYGASILKYNEGTTVNNVRGLFYNNSNTSGKGNIIFEDLQFQGTLNSTTRAGRWDKVAVFLDYYSNVTFNRCKFYNIAAMAMDIHFSQSFNCTDCWFENIAADGIRVRDTSNCFVSENYILRNGDDSIAIHQTSALPTIRQSLDVVNNTIINGGAIKILGARVANISGNIIDLGNLAGISLSYDSIEGMYPERDISVINNKILNTVYVTSSVPTSNLAAGIVISPANPRGTASTNGFIPGNYDTISSQWLYPWNYDNVNQTIAGDPVSLTNGIIVSNNTIRRTRPNVSAFSSYGYGSKLWQGVAYNPAIVDGNLTLSNCLVFYSGGFQNLIISENIFETARTGVSFSPATANGQYVNVQISKNAFFNTIDYGIICPQAASYNQHIIVDSNVMNCDVYRLGGNSNLNGTYINNVITPCAFNFGGTNGVIISNNIVQNVCQVANAFGNVSISNNTLIGSPVSAGFSTSNVGVGIVHNAGTKYNYIIKDSDPTSVNYGVISNVQVTEATAKPSTGTYVAGAFVKNLTPTISAGPPATVVTGWLRLTTGSNHVLGTDWAQVIAST